MKTLFIAVFLLIHTHLFSQDKEFVREYTYTAKEEDSKITSRAIALDQVKRILLEEIGVYIYSEMQINKEEKNEVLSELTKQQIESITAGTTVTKITEEKWNGETYYIKATVSVNPNEVYKNIARIAADHSMLKELEEVKRKNDEAALEIERLRKKLTETKSEQEKINQQKEYKTATEVLTASNLFRAGFQAFDSHEYDKAIQLFQKAMEINPNDPLLNNNLGSAYYKSGNYGKAIQYLEKAIEINPQYSMAFNNLGNVYSDKGNIDKAIELYENAVDLNSENYLAYYNLGLAYYNSGKKDKAIKYYKKTIKINPTYSEAYCNLGVIYYDKDDYDEAIEYFSKAIELNPNNREAYYNMGLAYGAEGKIDLRVSVFKKAANLGDRDAQQWLKNNGYSW
ncbi:MAG: tetratricopeptide repeat protein [Bacteroidota bacterium]|nr:tetratricopeptide repeat protein [Bacteroidota bacterium]